jgi:DNA-binding transcriptional regulator YiaG
MQTFGEKLIASARQAEEHSMGKRKLRTAMVEVRPVPNYDPRQIQELRMRLDLTRGIFGSVVGVSPKAVESWELGARRPSASALRLIAELDANPEYVRKIVTRA